MKKRTFREMYNMMEENYGKRGAESFENAVKTKTKDLDNVEFYTEEKPKKTTKKKAGK